MRAFFGSGVGLFLLGPPPLAGVAVAGALAGAAGVPAVGEEDDSESQPAATTAARAKASNGAALFIGWISGAIRVTSFAESQSWSRLAVKMFVSRSGSRRPTSDQYWSELMISPAARVASARQVWRAILVLMNLTEPSAMPMLRPPGWRLRKEIWPQFVHG
jgi:hypothetical protein